MLIIHRHHFSLLHHQVLHRPRHYCINLNFLFNFLVRSELVFNNFGTHLFFLKHLPIRFLNLHLLLKVLGFIVKVLYFIRKGRINLVKHFLNFHLENSIGQKCCRCFKCLLLGRWPFRLLNLK